MKLSNLEKLPSSIKKKIIKEIIKNNFSNYPQIAKYAQRLAKKNNISVHGFSESNLAYHGRKLKREQEELARIKQKALALFEAINGDLSDLPTTIGIIGYAKIATLLEQLPISSLKQLTGAEQLDYFIKIMKASVDIQPLLKNQSYQEQKQEKVITVQDDNDLDLSKLTDTEYAQFKELRQKAKKSE